MDEEIKDLCRQLRLPGIYQSYHTIAEDFTNPEEFLVRILNAEVQSREASRRERAIQQAGFPAYKRFEEIKPDLLPFDGRECLNGYKALILCGKTEMSS